MRLLFLSVSVRLGAETVHGCRNRSQVTSWFSPSGAALRKTAGYIYHRVYVPHVCEGEDVSKDPEDRRHLPHV